MMKKSLIIAAIFSLGLIWAQDDDDLDMDAMWDNTVWNEIEDIADEDIPIIIDVPDQNFIGPF